MIDNLNRETKMLEFEERVLIGWLANTVRDSANQYPRIVSKQDATLLLL